MKGRSYTKELKQSTVVVSQYIGHKDKDQACNAASQLITISSIISVGIMLFVALFHKPLLRILFGNIEADVMAAAITYFVISGLAYPFLAIYDSGAALFGTDQIAANGITNSLVMIAISFAIAMNLSIVTVVGQCVGAGDYSQATYYTKKLIKITYIGTLCISLAEILFLPWILKLYTLIKLNFIKRL